MIGRTDVNVAPFDRNSGFGLADRQHASSARDGGQDSDAARRNMQHDENSRGQVRRKTTENSLQRGACAGRTANHDNVAVDHGTRFMTSLLFQVLSLRLGS